MLPSPPPSAFSFLRPPRNLASQFELTTQSALPDHPTVADLPRAVWRNKRYVLEESLSRKGSKGRKSWIKRHGFFLVEIDTNDSPLSPYWACRLCDAKGQPEFFAAAATSSAADHLRKSHRIFESSQAADPDLSTDESERPKRRRLQYSAVPRARVKMIRELSLGLLINTNVPFSFFSDTFFQQLAWQLDPHLADQIPWSRQSMGRLLDDTYKSKKDEIKQELSDALTKIHLGFDLWTSPNRHAVMAVTAHFLDRQGKHQSRLLALRRQLGCHSGESLAVTLGQVVREWKIEDRVGTVISDNASSNDSCLVNFYGDLDAEMSLADVRARRMRCYGHILNLVARAFLYGEDFESFEAESQVFDLLGRREDDLRHWRKKGPVGKLHNVVKFIRSSPQRCELFKRISRENDEAQEYLLANYENAGLGAAKEDRKLFHHAVPDEAGGQDTNSQAELARGRPDRNRQLPARFRDCETDIHPRKSRQGPLSDRGSRQCDDGSGKPSGSLGIDDMGKDHRHYLRLSIMTAWQKLNEYYTKLGDSPLFAASIILHPSLGMNYLEVNWASEEQLVWVRDAKIGLSDYLDRWYHCNRPVDEQQKMIMDTSTSLSVPRTTTEVSVFKQWIKSRTAKTTVMGSELERYLRLEPQETEDPIEWWMAHQGQFPMISQLALDILAIPAMATDCERSFSLAKLTLTTQRLSMTTETLEKLQCLKNWVRHGAVKLGATIGGGEEVQWEIGDVSMEA
uniref:HAT C-terminal dimerisation domain-containing protein n=1 Tax=Fusarium oxysporum (strain Fo5176) TaxID=660025 RepID=A0A0D2XRV7_FUSOF